MSGKTKLFFGTMIKLIIAIVISCVAMFAILFSLYTPTYEVKLKGEVIGFVSSKAQVQQAIQEFLQKGDKENVGYVILKEEPTYEFKFAKKETTVDNEAVVAKVIGECDVYYRVYGINVNNEEKFVVESVKEAQEIVDQMEEAQKDYKKKGVIEISEKFVQEYELPEDVTVAVNDINDSLKTINDEYVASIKKSTTMYASSTYVIPEEILLAMIDENKSLNFRNPLDNGTITSRYGMRSLGNHKGLDIGAPIGTEIHVAEDGIVTYVGWYGGYGYLVIVQHGGGYETYYGHCSAFNCTAGDVVSKGDVIAYVGSTGRSTGPHCHFEVRVNDVNYDPEQFIK